MKTWRLEKVFQGRENNKLSQRPAEPSSKMILDLSAGIGSADNRREQKTEQRTNDVREEIDC